MKKKIVILSCIAISIILLFPLDVDIYYSFNTLRSPWDRSHLYYCNNITAKEIHPTEMRVNIISSSSWWIEMRINTNAPIQDFEYVDGWIQKGNSVISFDGNNILIGKDIFLPDKTIESEYVILGDNKFKNINWKPWTKYNLYTDCMENRNYEDGYIYSYYFRFLQNPNNKLLRNFTKEKDNKTNVFLEYILTIENNVIHEKINGEIDLEMRLSGISIINLLSIIRYKLINLFKDYTYINFIIFFNRLVR